MSDDIFDISDLEFDVEDSEEYYNKISFLIKKRNFFNKRSMHKLTEGCLSDSFYEFILSEESHLLNYCDI